MQALALKYRPKSFYELIGQEAVKENLIGALDSGRLGHAYLFSGLRGSGKTSSARIFAKDLLCVNGISSHACEVCQNCIAANEGRHLDIVEMDAASHRKIEDIRDLIEQTRYTPVSGRFKIFIIDEAHMLTKEASNAFLKTLEEPPAHVKFILATTDPLKLPATILSRTQHFRFKAIAQSAVIKHLEEILAKENVSFESEALRIIARSGSGSLRDTLTLLEQAIIFCNSNINTKAVADMLGILDPQKIDEILSVVAKGSHEDLCLLIKELDTSDAEMIISELITNLKEKFASPVPSFSLMIFERFFKILSEAKNMLSFGSDPVFVLYITLFTLRECFDVRGENLQNSINLNNLQTAKIPQILDSKNLQKNAEIKQTENLAKNTGKNSKYDEFLKLIYDRSYDLGEIFAKYIEFADFNGENITLISSLNPQDAQFLRKSSAILKEIALKTFGINKFIIKKKNELSNDELLNNILRNNLPKSQDINEVAIKNQFNDNKDKPQKNSSNEKIAELNSLFGPAKIERI